MIMTIIYKKKKRTVIFLISSFQITFEQKQKKSIKIKLLIGHDWLKHLPPVGLRAA